MKTDLAISLPVKAAYGATNMIEPEGHCGDCIHADMDAVTEDELEDEMTRCTVTGKVVGFDHSCGNYRRFGGES